MWQLFARTCLVFVLFVVPMFAFAQVSVDDTGLQTTGDDVYGNNYLVEGGNIGYYIGFYVIQPLLAVLGVILLLMILWAGLLWMTAGGVSDRVAKAKNILVHSVVGFVIVLLAYSATVFIVSALTT